MAAFLALLLAAGAAGWLLLRAGRNETPDGGGKRNITILKAIIWLGLAAALFAAKLFPLAFMILLAAGGITAIEIWRDRAIKAGDDPTLGAGTATGARKKQMQVEEAASILGVSTDASPEAIKSAHKKLISQLHPDKGGTDYLAAQINDARDALIRKNAPAVTHDESDN